jgi:inosose dehydratase
MTAFRVGNAPCSWGTLEFDQAKGEQIAFDRMLNELVETGYTGTELGDWGYMPTDSAALASELRGRSVTMLGAFVPVALKDPTAHTTGIEAAVKAAYLVASVATEPRPFLVLADNNGSVPERTKYAGRITPEMGLSVPEWRTFADGANKVARAVREATGLRTVFHHHCAGYVETPEEISRLLDLTDPELLGLVFDAGHYCYGSKSTDAVAGLSRFGKRVWYLHCKDCDPVVAEKARKNGWDYFEALRHGVFCELGKGCVDFAGILRWARNAGYNHYLLVEQDVLPGMGAPKESARRNREYLRSVELQLESETTVATTQGANR